MKKINHIVSKNSKQLASSLGLSPLDAIEWEVRLLITNKIISSTHDAGISVTELALLSGTSRARITKILKGDSFGISLDVLVRVLGALGEKMKISFRKAA